MARTTTTKLPFVVVIVNSINNQLAEDRGRGPKRMNGNQVAEIIIGLTPGTVRVADEPVRRLSVDLQHRRATSIELINSLIRC